MYLEERVEQLETLAVDHGRQIESVAKGLADLTVDVRSVRQDVTAGFARMDEQFAQVNERFDEIQQTQQGMQQTQQLILSLLTDRLS